MTIQRQGPAIPFEIARRCQWVGTKNWSPPEIDRWKFFPFEFFKLLVEGNLGPRMPKLLRWQPEPSVHRIANDHSTPRVGETSGQQTDQCSANVMISI